MSDHPDDDVRICGDVILFGPGGTYEGFELRREEGPRKPPLVPLSDRDEEEYERSLRERYDREDRL